MLVFYFDKISWGVGGWVHKFEVKRFLIRIECFDIFVLKQPFYF